MPYAQAAAWLGIPADHPFGLGTLPYGSFTTADRPGEQRVGVAIGDHVLDLSAATARLLPGRADLFGTGLLDAFLAAGDGAWAQVRADIVSWLSSDAYRVAVEDLLVTAAAVTMHLPFTVADYVDFYASEQHASNVGRIFRPDAAEPLTANWRHMPIGYHGRDRRRVRHAGAPPVRPVQVARWRRAGVRPVRTTRLRGRARVRRRGAQPARRASSLSTCSACAWSTTGPPGTSSPGRRRRSARSSASPSAPRCRPGWCRSPPWSTRGSGRRRGTPSCCPT